MDSCTLTKIVLYMYDDKTVQMSITSSYPYSYELAILGFSLPKFTNKYSSISYSFVYDKNDNEILAIYYEGIKSDDLYEYGQKYFRAKEALIFGLLRAIQH